MSSEISTHETDQIFVKTSENGQDTLNGDNVKKKSKKRKNQSDKSDPKKKLFVMIVPMRKKRTKSDSPPITPYQKLVKNSAHSDLYNYQKPAEPVRIVQKTNPLIMVVTLPAKERPKPSAPSIISCESDRTSQLITDPFLESTLVADSVTPVPTIIDKKSKIPVLNKKSSLEENTSSQTSIDARTQKINFKSKIPRLQSNKSNSRHSDQSSPKRKLSDSNLNKFKSSKISIDDSRRRSRLYSIENEVNLPVSNTNITPESENKLEKAEENMMVVEEKVENEPKPPLIAKKREVRRPIPLKLSTVSNAVAALLRTKSSNSSINESPIRKSAQTLTPVSDFAGDTSSLTSTPLTSYSISSSIKSPSIIYVRAHSLPSPALAGSVLQSAPNESPISASASEMAGSFNLPFMINEIDENE